MKREIKFQLLKTRIKFQPVFIIGCGRSGTTIFGQTLAQHPAISYLNERRDLWHKAYPELDIWSGKKGHVKLLAGKDDVSNRRTAYLRRLFYKAQVLPRKKILLEKLPINSFRLDFIKTCFPEAKFIYLHRNGLEVAASISKNVSYGWFGKNNIKYKLLLKLANSDNELQFVNNVAINDFQKGLLEWRLSVNHSENFFKNISAARFIELSYDDFVGQPEKSMKRVLDFLGLNFDEDLILSMCAGIERKSEKISEIDGKLSAMIGGEVLKKSMNNTYLKKY